MASLIKQSVANIYIRHESLFIVTICKKTRPTFFGHTALEIPTDREPESEAIFSLNGL